MRADEPGGGLEGAVSRAYAIMRAAYEGGVNFFDGAEGYEAGDAERVLGEALRRGLSERVWEREDLVISTKIFFGTLAARGRPGYVASRKVASRMGLSRKHIVEGVLAAKRRLGLDALDIVFCHRFDPLVGVEEVVRAFNELISRGHIYYWGTSEWSCAQHQEARGVALRLGLVPPQCDQPEYSLFEREKVEVEFAPLYPSLGLTTWSPLCSGALSGKYTRGGSGRLDSPEFKNRPDYKVFLRRIQEAEKLRPLAARLNVTMAQLAIAWTLSNPNISTVITGATSVEQVHENLGALQVLPLLTPEVLNEVEAALGTRPRLPRAMQQVSFRHHRVRSRY